MLTWRKRHDQKPVVCGDVIALRFYNKITGIRPVDRFIAWLGSRAIEEAIRFLNLESGDRLGHAIALGVDVREWYRAKSYMVSLTKQQYLDDVVSLYHKLVRYGLDQTQSLQESLKRQYSIRFRELYLKHMPLKVLDEILKDYWHDRRVTGEQRWDGSGTLDFDIYQYYHAWKLRGDAPVSPGYARLSRPHRRRSCKTIYGTDP